MTTTQTSTARVTEYLRQYALLTAPENTIDAVRTDTTTEAAYLTVEDLHALLAQVGTTTEFGVASPWGVNSVDGALSPTQMVANMRIAGHLSARVVTRQVGAWEVVSA